MPIAGQGSFGQTFLTNAQILDAPDKPTLRLGGKIRGLVQCLQRVASLATSDKQ